MMKAHCHLLSQTTLALLLSRLFRTAMLCMLAYRSSCLGISSLCWMGCTGRRRATYSRSLLAVIGLCDKVFRGMNLNQDSKRIVGVSLLKYIQAQRRRRAGGVGRHGSLAFATTATRGGDSKVTCVRRQGNLVTSLPQSQHIHGYQLSRNRNFRAHPRSLDEKRRTAGSNLALELWRARSVEKTGNADVAASQQLSLVRFFEVPRPTCGGLKARQSRHLTRAWYRRVHGIN